MGPGVLGLKKRPQPAKQHLEDKPRRQHPSRPARLPIGSSSRRRTATATVTASNTTSANSAAAAAATTNTTTAATTTDAAAANSGATAAGWPVGVGAASCC